MAIPEKLVQHYGCDAWMDGWDMPVTPWNRTASNKLLEYGTRPDPEYIADHIREMEEKPFHGILMDTGSYVRVFQARDVDESAFAAGLETLSRIEWDRFTDNFVMIYAASDMDWFSEEDWGPDGWVLRNVGMCAQAARAARCKGVCFDVEPYGGWGPWAYGKSSPGHVKQPHAEDKSFAEFQEVVRKRGAQFISRLQEELPDLGIHTFFLNSGLPDVLAESDPEKREEMLEEEFYGLVPAFLNGMLDAVGPGTVIHDGNECSYYYTEPLHFYHGYHFVHRTALSLADPSLHDKYRSHVRCAHALIGGNQCNMRTFRTTSTHLTPEERARFVEHNVYWALKSSDRYVWYFSMGLDLWTGRDVPPYLDEAIRSACDKVANGEPLGFDFAPIWQRGHDKLVAALTRPIPPRSAQIPRLGSNAEPPAIDGRVEDAAWNEDAALEPFEPCVTARDDELVGETQAWITFDDRELYLAFLCRDPEMDKVSASELTEPQKNGNDRVEVAIGTGPDLEAFYHIMVDCDNGRWDSLTRAANESYGTDSSWTGTYRTAARKADDHWAVEIAIPWKTLDMEPPGAGAELKGNLLRWRHPRPDGLQEFSSLARSRRYRYIESESFGTWVFE